MERFADNSRPDSVATVGCSSRGSSLRQRPILFSGEMVRAILEGRKTQTRRVCKDPLGPSMMDDCPYGEERDRLWVREAFLLVGGDSPNARVVYRASNDGPDAWVSPVWKPSIFMPRWASRISLEITQVRIERVQDISHADATAEGCRPYCVAFDKLPAQEYRELWDSINAKRGFGWDVNPWVWVIEFKRVMA